MNMINGFGVLSNIQLNKIKKTLNIDLPIDYQVFLEKNNGGLPKDKYLTITLNDFKEKLTLGCLLGINENPNYDLIGWNLEYKSDMPKSTVIIGTEYSSGLYVMITDETQKGIYYWDNSNDGDNVYFIAHTFTEFMKLWKIEE